MFLIDKFTGKTRWLSANHLTVEQDGPSTRSTQLYVRRQELLGDSRIMGDQGFCRVDGAVVAPLRYVFENYSDDKIYP